MCFTAHTPLHSHCRLVSCAVAALHQCACFTAHRQSVGAWAGRFAVPSLSSWLSLQQHGTACKTKQRARQHSTSLITCCRFYIRTNAHTTWHAQMEVQLLHQERSTLDCGSRETACKGECMFCAQESTLYPLLWQTTGMPRDTCIQVKQQQTDTKPTCIPCIPPRPLALLMQAEGPAQRYS